MSENDAPVAQATFDVSELQSLYASVSRCDGVDVAELAAHLRDLFHMSRSAANVQAYREGRPPWKKLVDEIVPVIRLLRHVGAQGHVRFPPNDQPPDAWFRHAEASKPIGIEVTRALGRSRVELAKDLRHKPLGRGFQDVPESAPQSAFDAARKRGRVTNSRLGITERIEASVTERLKAKAGPKYEGHTLLVLAPLASAPNNDWSPARDRLAAVAEQTWFERVVVMDDVGQAYPPIFILDRSRDRPFRSDWAP